MFKANEREIKDQNHLRDLIARKLDGEATKNELRELENLRKKDPDIDDLLQRLIKLKRSFEKQS